MSNNDLNKVIAVYDKLLAEHLPGFKFAVYSADDKKQLVTGIYIKLDHPCVDNGDVILTISRNNPTDDSKMFHIQCNSGNDIIECRSGSFNTLMSSFVEQLKNKVSETDFPVITFTQVENPSIFSHAKFWSEISHAEQAKENKIDDLAITYTENYGSQALPVLKKREALNKEWLKGIKSTPNKHRISEQVFLEFKKLNIDIKTEVTENGIRFNIGEHTVLMPAAPWRYMNDSFVFIILFVKDNYCVNRIRLPNVKMCNLTRKIAFEFRKFAVENHIPGLIPLAPDNVLLKQFVDGLWMSAEAIPEKRTNTSLAEVNKLITEFLRLDMTPNFRVGKATTVIDIGSTVLYVNRVNVDNMVPCYDMSVLFTSGPDQQRVNKVEVDKLFPTLAKIFRDYYVQKGSKTIGKFTFDDAVVKYVYLGNI